MSQNPYEILGVQPGADLDTIEAAYRHLNQTTNPTASADAVVSKRLEEICWAYGFLSDPQKRAKYDALTRHSWPAGVVERPDLLKGKPITRLRAPSNPETLPLESGQRVVISICEYCGRVAPVQYSSFNQNIGFLISRRHDFVEGDLCRDCIEYLYWRMTATTLLLGWWSLVSPLVNPGYLLGNLTSYLEARGLQRGRAAPPAATKPWKYFTYLILCGIAILLVIFFETIFFR